METNSRRGFGNEQKSGLEGLELVRVSCAECSVSSLYILFVGACIRRQMLGGELLRQR